MSINRQLVLGRLLKPFHRKLQKKAAAKAVKKSSTSKSGSLKMDLQLFGDPIEALSGANTDGSRSSYRNDRQFSDI